jgi:hypothetical protein
MTSSQYRSLMWEFIAASDMEKYDSVTAAEVAHNAEAGTMRAFLQERFASDFDFSLLGPEDWAVVSETWANLANAVDARRKFGVENRGVSLLMAYALESLQKLERK